MPLKDAQVSDAYDVYLNKAAVNLDKKPGSWFAQNSTSTPHQVAAEADDEDDYDALDDAPGLGAPQEDETDSQIDLLLKKKTVSNDKLLELVLGKKAADAKKKARAAAKSNIASNHTAPKPVTLPKRETQDNSDDEDEGRAAAFSSKRKTRDRHLPAYSTGGADSPAQIDIDATPADPREDLATMKALANGDQAQKEQDSDEEQRPSKRKPTSYLDELLSKKKKKKKGKGKA